MLDIFQIQALNPWRYLGEVVSITKATDCKPNASYKNTNWLPYDVFFHRVYVIMFVNFVTSLLASSYNYASDFIV